MLADLKRQTAHQDFGGFRNTVTKCLTAPRVIDNVAAAEEFLAKRHVR